MNDNEKLYHSALSRCAEQLDNMRDGDPITDVPDFLAAKLKQCQLAGAAKGGNTIGTIDRWTGHEIKDDPSLDFVEFVKLSDAAHLAGQSQATRAVPEGWREVLADLAGIVRVQNGNRHADINGLLARAETMLAAPTAQEVTQQAAKAETAEQAEGEQANVLPSMRDPLLYPDGSLGEVLEKKCFYSWRAKHLARPGWDDSDWFIFQKGLADGVDRARTELSKRLFPEAVAAEAESVQAVPGLPFANLASAVKRFEAQRAPTTSTVSAPQLVDGVRWDLFPGYLIDHCEGDIISEEYLQHAVARMLKDADYLRVAAEGTQAAPEEVRNQALEESATICDVAYKERGGTAFLYAAQEIRALRTTSGKGDAA